VQRPSDVTEVARTLAAHGGGAASLDLALDLVLNEVVEQARVATGATGAAIAFSRGGEMVCRATSGEVAPELGVRLETASGLSGACVQTGQVQQCNDAETDQRVDAEACRMLGVRSILVLPLSDGKETFGLFEIFSSRPNAFGDRDVNTLQALAHRVVRNKNSAESVAAAIRSTDEAPRAPLIEPKALLEDDELWQPARRHRRNESKSGHPF
jgi:putative methionine-R-sulfoxide reductase with GAF domain